MNYCSLGVVNSRSLGVVNNCSFDQGKTVSERGLLKVSGKAVNERIGTQTKASECSLGESSTFAPVKGLDKIKSV